MHYIKTDDGVRLAYSDRGSGRCVVLIAGYGAPAESWCVQEKALLKAGYRVICFDRRSHGRSENPEFGQNMLRQGQDINCLMEQLGLCDAVLVGQSQGASSVFSYVSQFGTKRLAGICDIDQPPKMINDDGWTYGMYGLNAESRPVFFDKPLAAPNRLPMDKRIIAKALLHSVGRKKFDEQRTKPLLLDHADADWRPMLEGIDVPVLFIAGENSPFWPCEHAEASSALCANGAFAVVEGSGHAVNWELPEKVNGLLLDFLATMPTWRELAGNAKEYSASALEPKSSVLSGKRILFLGSSVTNGAGSCCESFVEMLERRCGVLAVKAAINGTTLSDSGPMSYLKRLRDIDSAEGFDAFVCQLSTNDTARGFDMQSVGEAVRHIAEYAKGSFGCPVLFYTSPAFDSPAYGAAVGRLRELSSEMGFGVIDLWNDFDMSTLSPGEKALYFADAIHPTRAGYAKIFLPSFENALEALFEK